jgi:L-aminopeptidase/D-esterase-like protein
LNGAIGAGTGALAGGVMGGVIEGIDALSKGVNFWSGNTSF